MYVEQPCEPWINGTQCSMPLKATLAPSGAQSLQAFLVEVKFRDAISS
jgi:hypothetical protein